MGRSSRWFGILVLVLLTACASGGAGGQRIDRNLLTREQILETNRQNAYEVVENLRSNWLRTRGPTSLTQEDAVVQVYLDDNRLGGVETLRTINTTLIQYIRWYDGIAATGRWGLDHGAGVIYVSTRALQQ
ncbi:MAG TPA: hypothetical protein VF167_02265 [Longimicrobiaceae bacterium]